MNHNPHCLTSQRNKIKPFFSIHDVTVELSGTEHSEGWRVGQVWEFQDDQSFVAIKLSSMHGTLPHHMDRTTSRKTTTRGCYWREVIILTCFFQACTAGSWWRQFLGKMVLGQQGHCLGNIWDGPLCTENGYKGGLTIPIRSTKDYRGSSKNFSMSCLRKRVTFLSLII